MTWVAWIRVVRGPSMPVSARSSIGRRPYSAVPPRSRGAARWRGCAPPSRWRRRSAAISSSHVRETARTLCGASPTRTSCASESTRSRYAATVGSQNRAARAGRQPLAGPRCRRSRAARFRCRRRAAAAVAARPSRLDPGYGSRRGGAAGSGTRPRRRSRRPPSRGRRAAPPRRRRRVERAGGRVHGLAPCPEVVVGMGAVDPLDDAAQGPLEGVAVRIHEPGETQRGGGHPRILPDRCRGHPRERFLALVRRAGRDRRTPTAVGTGLPGRRSRPRRGSGSGARPRDRPARCAGRRRQPVGGHRRRRATGRGCAPARTSTPSPTAAPTTAPWASWRAGGGGHAARVGRARAGTRWPWWRSSTRRARASAPPLRQPGDRPGGWTSTTCWR